MSLLLHHKYKLLAQKTQVLIEKYEWQRYSIVISFLREFGEENNEPEYNLYAILPQGNKKVSKANVSPLNNIITNMAMKKFVLKHRSKRNVNGIIT